MSTYFILDGKTAVPSDDVSWWAQREAGLFRVALDDLPNGVKVSTVFLGMDHAFGHGPPMLFETMVFGGENDEDCERCTTWEQAEEQHRRMVAEALAPINVGVAEGVENEPKS